MGGFGSTRWGWTSAKNTVESSRAVILSTSTASIERGGQCRSDLPKSFAKFDLDVLRRLTPIDARLRPINWRAASCRRFSVIPEKVFTISSVGIQSAYRHQTIEEASAAWVLWVCEVREFPATKDVPPNHLNDKGKPHYPNKSTSNQMAPKPA
jgi:hypothetical protein